MSGATGTHVIRDNVVEGGNYKTMSRPVGIEAANLLQSKVTSIALNVYEVTGSTPKTDLLTAGTAISTTTGGPGGAASSFTSLQTDEGWDADSTGYCFAHVYKFTENADGTGSALTVQGGQRYRLEYAITATNADTGIVYITTVLDILSRVAG